MAASLRAAPLCTNEMGTGTYFNGFKTSVIVTSTQPCHEHHSSTVL